MLTLTSLIDLYLHSSRKGVDGVVIGTAGCNVTRFRSGERRREKLTAGKASTGITLVFFGRRPKVSSRAFRITVNMENEYLYVMQIIIVKHTI